MSAMPEKFPVQLTQFLQLALVILGPITVFIVANIVIFQYAQRNLDGSLEHCYTELDMVLPVKSLVLQSTIPVSSYLLTGKAAERENFEDYAARINRAMGSLDEHMKQHEDEHNRLHDIEAEMAGGFAHEFEMMSPIRAAWNRVEVRARRILAMRHNMNKRILVREIELLNADAENTATLLNDLYRKIKHRSQQDIDKVLSGFVLYPAIVTAVVGLWLIFMLARLVRSRS